jgi:hypothetical protein
MAPIRYDRNFGSGISSAKTIVVDVIVTRIDRLLSVEAAYNDRVVERIIGT